MKLDFKNTIGELKELEIKYKNYLKATKELYETMEKIHNENK